MNRGHRHPSARISAVLGLCAGLCVGLAACGGGSSAPTPPSITTQPQSATVSDGQQTTLAVAASSGTQASYQWQLNGVDVAAAIGTTYLTPPLVYGSTYKYDVVVSNSGGSVTSQTATISVTPIVPTVVTQPASVSVAAGASATFSVYANGSLPLTYQWLRNGAAIAGATGSSLVISPAQLSDSGAGFSVQITNAAGTAASQGAQLTVTP